MASENAPRLRIMTVATQLVAMLCVQQCLFRMLYISTLEWHCVSSFLRAAVVLRRISSVSWRLNIDIQTL